MLSMESVSSSSESPAAEDKVLVAVPSTDSNGVRCSCSLLDDRNGKRERERG